jgi:hypothetical protein
MPGGVVVAVSGGVGGAYEIGPCRGDFEGEFVARLGREGGGELRRQQDRVIGGVLPEEGSDAGFCLRGEVLPGDVGHHAVTGPVPCEEGVRGGKQECCGEQRDATHESSLERGTAGGGYSMG